MARSREARTSARKRPTLHEANASVGTKKKTARARVSRLRYDPPLTRRPKNLGSTATWPCITSASSQHSMARNEMNPTMRVPRTKRSIDPPRAARTCTLRAPPGSVSDRSPTTSAPRRSQAKRPPALLDTTRSETSTSQPAPAWRSPRRNLATRTGGMALVLGPTTAVTTRRPENGTARRWCTPGRRVYSSSTAESAPATLSAEARMTDWGNSSLARSKRAICSPSPFHVASETG